MHAIVIFVIPCAQSSPCDVCTVMENNNSNNIIVVLLCRYAIFIYYAQGYRILE